ncbi:penicillin-binding transpeptidase domain-containing protein, partial [Campylobacter concisus]|uniref:penicillin-binding transpeptidase domain-containing protein n=1 Tax=Campylobacter concisus TaxID=199 RepID=UPI0021564A0F
GNFEITTDPIKPGDKVNVEVTDKAGNKGNGEGTAGDTTYVDTTAPKVEVETGQILALIGGIDYAKSSYNRATQSKRQPGSSFKPFIYQIALDS